MVIMEYLGYSFLENYQIITKYFELVKKQIINISRTHSKLLKNFFVTSKFFLNLTYKYQININLIKIFIIFYVIFY